VLEGDSERGSGARIGRPGPCKSRRGKNEWADDSAGRPRTMGDEWQGALNRLTGNPRFRC